MGDIQKTLDHWVSAEGIEFADKAAEQNYRARAKRIADAIQLKKPDRVPVMPSFNMFPAFYTGINCETALYDYKKFHESWLQTAVDFNPDAMEVPSVGLSGLALELLGYSPLKLPGRHISSDSVYQFDEREFIEADELYDWYLKDPTDFMIRRFLPSVCDNLKEFSKLPLIPSMLSYSNGLFDGAALFANDGVIEALEKLVDAGKAVKEFYKYLNEASKQLKYNGFPGLLGGICSAPFDSVGDWFRGTYGIMTDLYLYPEQLKAVMNQRVPIEADLGVTQARRLGSPAVQMMLHKGTRSMLTGKQFEEFYWPGLKSVITRIIDAGYVPMPFFEGDYNGRLEIIKDIPKGKAVYCFEEIDIYDAKKALGDHVCFRGNVPNSLMRLGSAKQVTDYVKELINVFGTHGGLIVDFGMWLDKAKPENVRAMINATLEYGCS